MENRSLMDQVVTATSNVYQVAPADVRGKSRGRIISDARQMAMYVAREKGEYLARIAEYFAITPQAVSIATNRLAGRLKAHRPLKDRHDRVALLLANMG